MLELELGVLILLGIWIKVQLTSFQQDLFWRMNKFEEEIQKQIQRSLMK
jgi:hypothetical protein